MIGALPSDWVTMKQLSSINLYDNSLTGTSRCRIRVDLIEDYVCVDVGQLPTEWASLTQIQRLRLDSNALSGMFIPE